MVQDPRLYMLIKKADFGKSGADPKVFFWYEVLKDYRRRFRKDRFGFIRVPSQVFFEDYGFDRIRVWRYNRLLEDKGLIELDKVHRGGRTWIGFRII